MRGGARCSAEVQKVLNCGGAVVVQRYRGAEVQWCSGAVVQWWCRGADMEVLKWC